MDSLHPFGSDPNRRGRGAGLYYHRGNGQYSKYSKERDEAKLSKGRRSMSGHITGRFRKKVSPDKMAHKSDLVPKKQYSEDSKGIFSGEDTEKLPSPKDIDTNYPIRRGVKAPLRIPATPKKKKAKIPKRKRTTSSSYLNEKVNFGGEIKTRGEVYKIYQKEGASQKNIGAWMMGAKTIPDSKVPKSRSIKPKKPKEKKRATIPKAKVVRKPKKKQAKPKVVRKPKSKTPSKSVMPKRLGEVREFEKAFCNRKCQTSGGLRFNKNSTIVLGKNDDINKVVKRFNLDLKEVQISDVDITAMMKQGKTCVLTSEVGGVARLSQLKKALGIFDGGKVYMDSRTGAVKVQSNGRSILLGGNPLNQKEKGKCKKL